VDANPLKEMVGPWGLEPQTSTVSIARLGITTTYNTAGTAKVRGSHTRHTFCGLGCGLETLGRNENVGPHKKDCTSEGNHASAAMANPSTTLTSPFGGHKKKVKPKVGT